MNKPMVHLNNRKRRGLTLVEVLISLLITSLIALGVASMLYAASYGTSSRRDVRQLAIRSQQVRVRLDDAVRNARAILAVGKTPDNRTCLILWKDDSNQENRDTINLSELQLIEWTPATRVLCSYQAVTLLEADPSYSSGSDFLAEADQARANGDLKGTIWSEAVTLFELSTDKASPIISRLITWRMTIEHELLTESLAGSAAVRSPGEVE